MRIAVIGHVEHVTIGRVAALDAQLQLGAGEARR
jgi:hypothetical protein